jgi:hypothetical protein
MVDAETITMDSFQRKYGLPLQEEPPTQHHHQYSAVQKRPAAGGQPKPGHTRLEIRSGDIIPPGLQTSSKRVNEEVQSGGDKTKANEKNENRTAEDYSRKPLPASPKPLLIKTAARSGGNHSAAVRVSGNGDSGGGRDVSFVTESAVIVTSEEEEGEEQVLLRRVPRPPVRRRPKSTPANGIARSKSSPNLKDSSR